MILFTCKKKKLPDQKKKFNKKEFSRRVGQYHKVFKYEITFDANFI